MGLAPKSLGFPILLIASLSLRYSAFRSSAKSIAVRKLQSQQKLLKNLRGGLRGATRHSIPLHASNSASAASAKSIAPSQIALAEKFALWAAM